MTIKACANTVAAIFSLIAAVLWLVSTTSKVKVDPTDTGFQIRDGNIDVLETAKKQVRWNLLAAAAASVAAAAQAAAQAYAIFSHS